MSTRHERVLLALTVFAILFAQTLLYPGVDVLVGTLGAATTLDASMWFLAAEFGAFVAFAPVWGAASDHLEQRVPLVTAGALLGGLGYVTLVALPVLDLGTFGIVLLLRVFQGGATIGAFSLAMTMLMDLEGGHGQNMGAAGIAIGAGTAVGAPLGGQLYELGALVPPAVAGGALFGGALLSRFVTDRVPDVGRRDPGRLLAGVRETPALGLPYAFGFIDRLTAGFFALVGTIYFRTVLELGPGQTGLLLALFFAPFAVLQYPFGVLSDRVGRTLPIVVGSAAYGVGVAAVGLADGATGAGAAMLAVGILGATMAPATMALVTDLAPPGDRGVAMAGFNVFGSVGFLAGIVGGGTVAGALGFTTAFVLAGAVEVAIALVAIPAFVRLDVDRRRRFDG